jgi:hypothetical protein
MPRYTIALCIVFFLLLSSTASAHELPRGFGLSAQYPDDRGIERDPSVLLTENFETGGIDDLAKSWDAVNNTDGEVIAFREDAPVESAGKRCIEFTATVPKNDGGHLYKQLPREVDQAFARFYVKFPEDAGYIHHFVHFGGYRPATRWPQGGAGELPRGGDRMTVGIEPYGQNGRLAPPGNWNCGPPSATSIGETRSSPRGRRPCRVGAGNASR